MTEEEISKLGAELRKATLEAGYILGEHHRYEVPNLFEEHQGKRWELIIALAGNPYYCVPKEEMAKNVIEQADAIIKELEKADESKAAST